MSDAKAEQLKAYAFKPGQSGNPSGRARLTPASTEARYLWSCPIPPDLLKILNRETDPRTGKRKRGRPKKNAPRLEAGTTFGQATVLALYIRAIKTGDALCVKTLATLVQGLPSRELQVSGGYSVASVDMDELRGRLMALSGESKTLLEPIHEPQSS